MSTKSLGRDADAAARRFQALSEGKRLRILEELASGERCACDLSGCCEDSQPLLSFHLRTLREAGLVETRREGRWIHYRLDRPAIRELGERLLALAERAAATEGGCCGPADGDGRQRAPATATAARARGASAGAQARSR